MRRPRPASPPRSTPSRPRSLPGGNAPDSNSGRPRGSVTRSETRSAFEIPPVTGRGRSGWLFITSEKIGSSAEGQVTMPYAATGASCWANPLYRRTLTPYTATAPSPQSSSACPAAGVSRALRASTESRSHWRTGVEAGPSVVSVPLRRSSMKGESARCRWRRAAEGAAGAGGEGRGRRQRVVGRSRRRAQHGAERLAERSIERLTRRREEFPGRDGGVVPERPLRRHPVGPGGALRLERQHRRERDGEREEQDEEAGGGFHASPAICPSGRDRHHPFRTFPLRPRPVAAVPEVDRQTEDEPHKQPLPGRPAAGSPSARRRPARPAPAPTARRVSGRGARRRAPSGAAR